MTQAPDFALSGTVSTGGSTTHLAGQFQAPDIVELTITPATGAPVGVLFVGTKSYVKAPDGSWKSHLMGSAGSTDPRMAFAVLDKASGITATSSEGGQTTYSFTLPGSVASSIVQGSGTTKTLTLKGSAVVHSGMIGELMFNSTASPAAFVADIHYTSVGTAPPLSLPAGV